MLSTMQLRAPGPEELLGPNGCDVSRCHVIKSTIKNSNRADLWQMASDHAGMHASKAAMQVASCGACGMEFFHLCCAESHGVIIIQGPRCPAPNSDEGLSLRPASRQRPAVSCGSLHISWMHHAPRHLLLGEWRCGGGFASYPPTGRPGPRPEWAKPCCHSA